MRVNLQRDYKFEAAHHLPRVPAGHKCARMHGHSYLVTVEIEGEIASDTGWLMDFGAIDEVVTPLVRRLDHRVLNDLEGLENPTSETLAQWIWRALAPQLPLASVKVSETRNSSCTYRGG